MNEESQQADSAVFPTAHHGRACVRKWLATALLYVLLVAWPLGGLDWRTWQHGYREWCVERKIHTGMSLDDVLAVMPAPTRTAGHAGTQYLEFENGDIAVLLDFREQVAQVSVKPPAGMSTPNWVIAAGLVVLAAYVGYLWWRDKPAPPGHCPHCAYDLRGNISGRCPECGHRVARLVGAMDAMELDSTPSPDSEDQVERRGERN
ncbi:MAG: hypothetical protein JSV78_12130 [Phycisphaerales bacterium]|nr:MAG: hypothetical protein JSV78_12130 [Phycisphaerales bacterium]